MDYSEQESIQIVYDTMYSHIEHGSFVTSLMDAWTNADGHNFRRLSMGFPKIGEAMFAFRLFNDAFCEAAKKGVTLKEVMGPETHREFLRAYHARVDGFPTEAIEDFLDFWDQYVVDVKDSQAKSLMGDIEDKIAELRSSVKDE